MIVPVARPLRTRMNRALHELRRPVQLLALRGGSRIELEAITAALDELDRIVNGSRGSAEPTSAEADRLRVAAAIQNIVVNALEHGDAGTIEISASPLGGTVVVRNRVGDRRAPGGDPRRGHGLELIAEAAEAAGGRFTFQNDGCEAVATLALGPRAEPLAER